MNLARQKCKNKKKKVISRAATPKIKKDDSIGRRGNGGENRRNLVAFWPIFGKELNKSALGNRNRNSREGGENQKVQLKRLKIRVGPANGTF